MRLNQTVKIPILIQKNSKVDIQSDDFCLFVRNFKKSKKYSLMKRLNLLLKQEIRYQSTWSALIYMLYVKKKLKLNYISM